MLIKILKEQMDEIRNSDEIKNSEDWLDGLKEYDGFGPNRTLIDTPLKDLVYKLTNLGYELNGYPNKDIIKKIENIDVKELTLKIASRIYDAVPIIYKWNAIKKELSLFDCTLDGICRVHAECYSTNDTKLAEWIMRFKDDEIEVESHELNDEFEAPKEGFLDEIEDKFKAAINTEFHRVKYAEIDLYELYANLLDSDDSVIEFITDKAWNNNEQQSKEISDNS